MKVMTRDELVRKVTAFTSFADMQRSMDEHGYVPTLRGFVDGSGHRTTTRQRKWNELVNRLRAEVLKAGYRYFAKGKIHGGK